MALASYRGFVENGKIGEAIEDQRSSEADHQRGQNSSRIEEKRHW